MGANESVLRTPSFLIPDTIQTASAATSTDSHNHVQPVLASNHPLNALLHHTTPPPKDPESDFYIRLFNEFIIIARTSFRPLTSLVSTALSVPTSTQAAALSISLRAAVYQLRHGPQSRTLGALYFTHAVLSELRSLAPTSDAALLSLAATPAELQLPLRDRMDLAKSLRAHLVAAVLHLLKRTRSTSSVEPPRSEPQQICADMDSVRQQLTAIAVPVLLLVLTTDTNIDATLTATLIHHSMPYDTIVGLLDALNQATSNISPSVQLTYGVCRTETRLVASAGNNPSVWNAWDNLTSATAAINLKIGFADVVTALSMVSHRLVGPRSFESKLTENGSRLPTNSQRSKSTAASHDFMSTSSLNERVSAAESQAYRITQLLALLNFLCRPTKENNPFYNVVTSLKDACGTKVDEDVGNGEYVYSFSSLYDVLGQTMADPSGALLGFILVVKNERFRRFALARTDPDVLFMPLLASLRVRCTVGAVPADAYLVGAVLMVLTSDKGFCDAIGSLAVPETWLSLLVDQGRLSGEVLTVGEAVLVVCTRVVQQSVVMRRKRTEEYLCGLCLGVMGNVASEITNIQPFVAERLVSLVEFLGRRRKKSVAQLEDKERVTEETNNGGVVQDERCRLLVEKLSEMIGLTLEIIVGVLKARSTVAANKHLVYVLMHRDGVLDGEHIAGSSVKARALVHMIGRMVRFFGDCVEWETQKARAGQRAEVRDAEDGGRGALGISVDRVFEAIEQKARLLDNGVFAGVPGLEFRLNCDDCEPFLRACAESLIKRLWSSANEEADDDQVCWQLSSEVPQDDVVKFRPSR